MLEAAQMTAPISLTGLPQRAMASCAAFTAISASTESWSLERSGMCGTMRSGSRMPDFSTTKRDLMPEAFSTTSAEAAGGDGPGVGGVEALGEGVVGRHQFGVGERVFGGVQAGGGYDRSGRIVHWVRFLDEPHQ